MALPQLPSLNWQQGRSAPARQRSISTGQLPVVLPQLEEPTTPRGSAETITAAQRLAAISPGPSLGGTSSAPGSPSVHLGGDAAPSWPQLAWAAAAPGSPRAVRSSAPARPANWQRQVAALEALTGTQSPRAASHGGSEFSAEGPEWAPGSPRSSLGHSRDPKLQSAPRQRPSRLAAASGSSTAAMPPRSSGGSTLSQQAGVAHTEHGSGATQAAAAQQESAEAQPVDAAASDAASTPADEEEEALPFPEDPGMSSFSSGASAAAAAVGTEPPGGLARGPAGGQVQLQSASVAALPERPTFPEDPGQGKSAAPHALHQLSPSAPWAAAAASDAGSPPATPSPSTPRKKRGGLFSTLNRILRF